VTSLASYKRSCILWIIRLLVHRWMLWLLWRDFSVTLKLSGSARGWSLVLLVTRELKRCRLSGGCPTTPQVDSYPGSLSRLTRHHLLSTVHLLSRCSSLWDSRFYPVRGRRSSLMLVLGVARRATMLRSAPGTGLLSLLSRQPTLA
jgi:hypothetical protein